MRMGLKEKQSRTAPDKDLGMAQAPRSHQIHAGSSGRLWFWGHSEFRNVLVFKRDNQVQIRSPR